MCAVQPVMTHGQEIRSSDKGTEDAGTSSEDRGSVATGHDRLPTWFVVCVGAALPIEAGDPAGAAAALTDAHRHRVLGPSILTVLMKTGMCTCEGRDRSGM